MQPSTLYPIQVADLITKPASADSIAKARTRRGRMFGDVPRGATVVIRTLRYRYSLRYASWEELVWLEEALAYDRRPSTRNPGESLNVALDQYEANSQQLAAA